MKNYFVLLLIAALLVGACSKTVVEIVEKRYLGISEVCFEDVGTGDNNSTFELVPISGNLQRCTLTIPVAKKNDTIKSIEAFTQGEDLFIDIITSPYDWGGELPFTGYEVSFNVGGIQKGAYKVWIEANGSKRPSTIDWTVE